SGESDDQSASRRRVSLANRAGYLHVVWPAQRDRGGVGQGVLMAERTGGQAVRADALLAEAGLERQGPSLLVGGVHLTEIADGVGTPAYVYNLAVVRQRYRALD